MVQWLVLISHPDCHRLLRSSKTGQVVRYERREQGTREGNEGGDWKGKGEVMISSADRTLR